MDRRIRSKSSQSAMEYLMTYGWVILIIAVVMGVMFSLGIFSNRAPTGQPGACQVLRPNGAGSVQGIGLSGVCNGQLPEFVAYFAGGGNPSGFSSDSYITATVLDMAGTNMPMTVSMWINVPPNEGGNIPFFALHGTNAYSAYEIFRGGSFSTSEEFGLHRCTSADTFESTLPLVAANTWYFVAYTVRAPNYAFYLDGNSNTMTNVNTYSTGDQIVIGGQYNDCDGGAYIGYISNVQLYNTALSSSTLNAMYISGIGGAPIDLNNLVGWWPLNGNANDYSGNGATGNAVSVTYTNGWTSGYTQP